MIIQIEATDNFVDCIEARTNDELAHGLLGQRSLKPGQGMLFFYEEEIPLSYWMPREMQFPIDIIFIGENGKVNEVFQDCLPGEMDEETGGPQRFEAPAKWVLEIGAGGAESLGIAPGVKINFDDTEEEEGGLV